MSNHQSTRFTAFAAFVALAFVTGCKEKPAGSDTATTPRKSLGVVVTVPPIADFVEHVAGEEDRVEILVGPGQNAHNFEPTPKQITALSECDVFFRVGLAFEEPLLTKIRSLRPDLNVVDLREGVKLRKFLKNEVRSSDDGTTGVSPTDQEVAHADDQGHDHDEHAVGAPDPHHWMDPRIAARQVDMIAETLAKLDPARADAFRSSAKQYQDELAALHADLSRILAPFHGREFFVFHPGYGYFADAYRLTQVAIEFEGKEPSAQQLTRLIERARKARIRAVFVQPQYSRKGAEVMAEALGAETVMADALPRDYVSELQALGAKLLSAFGGGSGGAEKTEPVNAPESETGDQHP